MDLNLIACLIFAVFVVVALGAILLLTRPNCPECGSRSIAEISKEPLGMRGVDYSPGEGGYAMTQIRYNVKWRCNECQATWERMVSETR